MKRVPPLGPFGAVSLVLLAGAFLFGSAHMRSAPRDAGPAGGASSGGGKTPPGKWGSVEEFVKAHWAYPLPPMGPPPPSWKGKERTLLPKDCGSCHEDQYKQWRTSLHAKAMGPGVYGQLVDLWRTDPAQARGCNECHAPLAEQQKRLPAGTGPFASWAANPAHVPALEMAGLACASCHVRNWRVHGPPKRETPAGVNDATTEGKHGGVERTPFFEQSQFCAKCHQHQGSGPNGKPIQNTFNEWKASIWSADGVNCQKCHMPKRKHLWRGIHDKEMTQGAVGLDVTLDENAPRGTVAATITLTNQGAGHYFPTYITPSVELIAELEDSRGTALPGTRRIVLIERKLSSDFSREIYDTRIPPQKSFVLRYRKPRPAGAARLRVRVHVKPDNFYFGFFSAFLRDPNLSAKSRALIEKARGNAARSAYDIFDDRLDLAG